VRAMNRCCVLLLLACALPAQLATATWAAHREAALAAAVAAAAAAKQAVAALRADHPEAPGPLVNCLADIERRLGSDDLPRALDAATGAGPAIRSLPAAAQAKASDAFVQLTQVLQQGAQAKAGAEALAAMTNFLQLYEREEEGSRKAETLLRSIADGAAGVQRLGALPAAELASLRVFVAKEQQAQRAPLAKKAADKASAAMAKLEAGYPELRAKLEAATGSAFEAQYSRLDESLDTVRALLLGVDPSLDVTPITKRLDALEAEGTAMCGRGYGKEVHERLLFDWNSRAGLYAGWTDERAEVTPAAYLANQGNAIQTLNHRLTANAVNHANMFLASALVDEHYRRCAAHPELVALVERARTERKEAVARLLEVAGDYITAFEQAPPTTAAARDRLVTLADWDLRAMFEDAAEQWPLVARLHALTDAFDRRELGDAAALAKIRDSAQQGAEQLWIRMAKKLPLTSYDPQRNGRTKGRLVAIDKLLTRTSDFAPGEHDAIAEFKGRTHALAWSAPLRAELARAASRFGADAIAGELFVVAWVEAPTQLRLLGPSAAEGVDVPATKLRVIGLRQGPVVYLEQP
jgi:hypothetical protein